MPSTDNTPTSQLVAAVLDSFLNDHPEWVDADGRWTVDRPTITVSPAPSGHAVAIATATDAADEGYDFILALESTDNGHWRLYRAFTFRPVDISSSRGWEVFTIAPAHEVDVNS